MSQQLAKYRAIDAINCSSLKPFLKSPAHYLHEKSIGDSSAPTDHFHFGGALHTYVLEPEKADSNIYVWDDSKRPNKSKTFGETENKAWKKQTWDLATGQNMDVITPAQFESIKRMRDALYKHPLASLLLEDGFNKFEEIITWEWAGIKFKAILDVRNPAFILDLKSDADADPDKWVRNSFWKLLYWLQAGMYYDGDLGGGYEYKQSKDFYFVVVEKKPPYGVSVHRVRGEVIDYAVQTYREQSKLLIKCIKTGKFPGYEFRTWPQPFSEISLPSYMR